jgi:hypothetical protein
VISNQTVQVNVDLVNRGINPVASATFGWSVNGSVRAPVSWTANPLLNLLEQRNIAIGSFQAIGANTFNIVVWVDSLNGQPDTVNGNDTVFASTKTVPLAEFVAPFVDDTIYELEFDVNVKINTQTGAPVSPPEMILHTITNGYMHFYDTVAMVQNGNQWQAHTPPQYYKSKVIYSTTITDATGNSITLMDSIIIHTNKHAGLDTGYNLTVSALTEPVNRNIGGQSCSDEYAPLIIVLANPSENDYYFSINPVLLSVEVNNAINYSITKTLDSGILRSEKRDTIIIDPAFPVYRPGQYDIKVWLTSAIDNIIDDDTLESIYLSERLGLPIDENFSANLSSEFIVEAVNTPAMWSIVSQGSGNDTVVKPVFGSGMLAFTGSIGAMTKLYTRQLELRGATLPTLEFWYFHDTAESEDYTDVRITTDGGVTYTLLKSVLKQDSVYGWRHYTADLTPYINGQCINILFEAMQMSAGSGGQYIDSINIGSLTDVAISELLLPEVNVCDRKNKNIGIVLSVLVNQAIDFSLHQTNLIVEISGRPVDILPLQKRIAGNSSDTVWLSGIDLQTGNKLIRACLSAPVDNTPANDTLTGRIDVNPKMAVRVRQESTPSSCLMGGIVVYPSVTIDNIGDMDLFGIELLFQIDTGETGDPVYVLFKETCTDTIPAGSTLSHTFTNSYTVPWKRDYYSRITAYLQCDSTLIDTVNEVQECVEINDLEMLSIDSPSSEKDTVGKAIQVTASIYNHSDYTDFTDVNITVVVENSQGEQTDNFTEKKGRISLLSTASHTFTRSCTVPSDTAYFLTVYIDSYDSYLQNDTITIRRETVPAGTGIRTTGNIDGFTLGQNIPNPATNTTRIDYSIPEAGEVIFHVHSISGQLLYSKTIEAPSGANSIKLNTTAFAAGVYYYSIEYKGQKRVKRMSVTK